MKYLFILTILSTCLSVYSQTITGKVVDPKNEPVEFASVRLFSQKDSTVVNGIYTDQEGKFVLENVVVGSYYIKVTFSGLETKFIDSVILSKAGTKLQLGIIQLGNLSAQEIEEVVITGSLDALKTGIDKKVYTVSDDISTRGGSVTDALNNIPSIDIDENGNISLRGDGNVTILIDGRPSALALGDGKNVLSSIPANSIERIEVVTNPSAKYDPDGTSGIINIVLKKNKLRGINTQIMATAATGNLYEGSATFGFRNQKWNTLINYSSNYFEGYRNNFSDLTRVIDTDSSNHLNQSRRGTDSKFDNTLVLGADYHFTDRSVLSSSITGTIGERTRTGNLENRLYDQNEALFNRWNRNSEDPEMNNNFDLNLNYSYKLKANKGDWSVNMNHSSGENKILGFYEEEYYDIYENPANIASLNQRLSNNEDNKFYTAQTDFSYIFDSIKARMETGFKAIVSDNNVHTFSETQDTVSQLYFADTLSNFDYRYNEQIYSWYGTFGQELGKFKYQFGIRAEYALQTPELLTTGEIYDNTYKNLYPSAHVKYELAKGQELSISYSKRINRASAHQLNPFTSYADPFNLRSGNPALQPEYIDSYDLGYSLSTKKFNVSFSTFHRRTKDVINRVKIYYPNNVSIVTFNNVDESISTGFEGVLIFKPFPWFKNNLSFNANYIDYKSSTEAQWNNDGFNWSMKYIASIEFWKKSATVQVNFQYRAPMIRPQGIVQPRTGTDISFEKRLADKKWSLGFKVTDVFNQRGFYLKMEQEGIQQTSEFKWLTRRAYMTITYRFGKFDMKVNQPRNNGGGGED